MKVSDLTPNPKNPRAISQEKLKSLKQSLVKYGDMSGFVFNKATKRLVGGHQRSKVIPPDSEIKIEKTYSIPTASKTVAEGFILIGGERFKYREVEADEQWETEAMIAANKHGGEWQGLEELIKTIPDVNLELIGFSVPEIEALNYEVKPIEVKEFEQNAEENKKKKEEIEEKQDSIPEKVPAKSKLGELWLMGEHRLLIGDCTIKENVERLMDGKKADMVFTDPPYNLGGQCDMHAKSIRPDSYGKLKNSEWDQSFEFKTIIPSLEFLSAADFSIYICTSHLLIPDIMAWLTEWSDTPGLCIWEKSNPMPSLRKRHWTWALELICYGTKGKHVFNFPSSGHAPNVWHFASQTSERVHPTQKPVAIPEHAILHSSNEGQIVADLFCGSGSTLIACEKTKRVCYGMEISPEYADVIIARWEKFTGKKAVLVS